MSYHFKRVLFFLISLISIVSSYSQELVSGQVTDKENLEPLIGVNILIKGGQTGTITDIDGFFELNASPSDTLIFSFTGYDDFEVIVGNQKNIKVPLAIKSELLQEVTVVGVGYGTARESDVTGSILHVGSKELNSRPVNNVLEALQGKASGVDITSNERPGETGSIRIRGVRSITASGSPLYVIDGMTFTNSGVFESLNPQDIESIDILKDASATAIYGSRGANGVILVTTKKGKEGRMTLNYSGAVSFDQIQDRTQMMSASEYITWRRWAKYYADPVNSPRGDQPTIENDQILFLAQNDTTAWANIAQGWASGQWDGSQVNNTDWTGMVLGSGITQNHTLSASGGSAKFKAYGSFGFLDNQGTMIGQSFKRYNSKIGVELTPSKWFEMGFDLNSSYSIQQFGTSRAGGGRNNNIYLQARNMFTYALPYTAEGERIPFPGGDDLIKTVAEEWLYNENDRRTLQLFASMYAQVSLLPNLKYRLNFGPDLRTFKNGIFIDGKSAVRLDGINTASFGQNNQLAWTLDNLIFYDQEFGDHKLGITLLQTAYARQSDNLFIEANGIPYSPARWYALENGTISQLNRWNTDLSEQQLMSYMARMNYGFSEKYLLTVSGRWDGASQLSDGNKWAFFPSAALAWRASEEPFLKNIDWLSSLKVRVGLGTTGNAAVRPYSTKGGLVSLFYPFGNEIESGSTQTNPLIVSADQTSMPNLELGWERTTQYNIGLDFDLFNSRVYGTLDLYTSFTKDLLLQLSIPTLTGFTSTIGNVGETRNRGFDLNLNTTNIKTKDFNWTSTLNVAWTKDEIITLANGKEDDIANRWFIGESVSVIYDFDSDGIWQPDDMADLENFKENGHNFEPGNVRPADQNGDFLIDANDDRVIVGNRLPRWTLGMTNTISYKGFDLSAFIFGRLDYTFDTGGEGQGGRFMQRSIDYYNENNTNAEWQKPVFDVGGGDPYFRALGYRNGSFIKIRNITLGYELPQSKVSRLGMQSMRLYLQATNPGFIYSPIDWIDLDLGTSTFNRGYVVGFNVQF